MHAALPTETAATGQAFVPVERIDGALNAGVVVSRQIRFTSVQEVTKLAKTVKAYVREAIEIERAGLKVPFKKTEEIELPAEFESKLARNAKLKAAFAALTPGRQRGYIFHFSQPKLSTTRAARVEKHIPRILEGLGLDD